MQIGEHLVATGRVTRAELDTALAQQRDEGGQLGQQLLLSGALDRRALYDALAELWETRSRDLIADPPDPTVAGRIELHDISSLGWVPCELEADGTLVVATSVRPTPELIDDVRERFGTDQVEFVASTHWDVFRATEDANRGKLQYLAEDELAEQSPQHSARPGLTRIQLYAPLVLLAAFIAFAVLEPRKGFVVLLSATNVVFLLSILFKVGSSIRSPIVRAHRERRRLAEMEERDRRGLPPVWEPHGSDADLPVYTILIPAFRESNIIPKLISNLGALDYPRSKLDVIVLMEESDPETVEAARRVSPPDYVRLLVVPAGHPQTKPRACNYGLAFARGKYVVIYDAEDKPEPLQLRKAVAAFERDAFEHEHLGSTRPRLACVQAALHYFNADYNVLTRMFAIEYAHWFESMLPGIEGSGVPLPLGGTSNHFDTVVLKELGAWDPYNVTEDADLGLRASVQGYRVDVLDSSTGEEACAAVSAWIPQRTRWIKGYMITAAVNLRHPIQFLRRVGPLGMVGMIGLILGTPLTFLAYPLVLGFTLITYVGVQFIGLDLPSWVVVSSLVTAVAGNGLMILVSGLVAAQRYNWRIGIFAVLNPLYWCLHSWAAWRALFQTIFSPHHWEKTPHGISEDYESTAHV
ncbi:glycosyltransferase [Nocardioides sp. Root190]|uniref:glycosyltransferase n=1 Tax=Nocardioides sp. Root190 TaxID=1736488 RepID=UPI000A5757F8|nr:glycosyltransferase [Nocardioides sp. Root190]